MPCLSVFCFLFYKILLLIVYLQPPQGQGFAPPVTGEEGDAWMGAPGEQMVPLNCPPGLEYLTMIDQLIVKQKLEMLEAAAGVMGYGLETANKYKIKNVLGQVCQSKCQILDDDKNLSFHVSRMFIKPRKTQIAALDMFVVPPDLLT